MNADQVDVEAREAAVAKLLARHPDGLLVALGDDGFRLPMPDAPELSGFQTVPVPPNRATMADLVVTADAMTVITTWERSLDKGVAIGTVRLKTDPDRPVMLAIVDARHRHGVWLGVIGRLPDNSDGDGTPLDGSLLTPSRPRMAVLRKDLHAVITGIDDSATGMLGWPPEQMIGVRSLEFIHPDDHARAVSTWLEMVSRQEATRSRLRHRCQDGTWLWVEIENSILGTDHDGGLQLEARLADISEEMAAHEEVRRREQLFRRLAESLPVGVVQADHDGRVVYANARVAAILGIEQAATLTDQFASLQPQDRANLEAAIAAALAEGSDHELEVDLHLPVTGEPRRCTAGVVALSSPEGTCGVLVSLHDITDSARMREELRARATFDALTGCLNRASILATLEQALAWNHDTHTAAIYIDLDKFKQVNDTLGHAAGDELLVHVAHCLTSVLREQDQVGRLGGDEFLIICPGLEDPTQATSIADRIRDSLHGEVTLQGATLTVSASIGLAIGRHGTHPDDMVARADTAMYESKRHRDDRVLTAAQRSSSHRDHASV
jgi:diguanylate cyclase (GGDEF)-like protein/PAS domain S-box-containing protein